MNHFAFKLFLAVLMVSLVACNSQAAIESHSPDEQAKPASGGHALPQPSIELVLEEVIIPFEFHSGFPVPVIEMEIAGQGPFRFVVDTGTSSAFVLRQSIVKTLPSQLVGYAMLDDGSGLEMQKVPIVLLESAQSGEMLLSNIMTIAIEPSADHAASIPDDLDGIVGMDLFRDHLISIDFHAREIRVRENLDRHPDANAIPFDYSMNAIEIPVTLAGQPLTVFVDSGHRGTLTLPVSLAEKQLMSEPLQALDAVATVTHTYSRQRSKIAGNLDLSGYQIEDPPVVFADEHTPMLLGNGILQYFAITIDMRNRLISFNRDSDDEIKDVELFTAGIR